MPASASISFSTRKVDSNRFRGCCRSTASSSGTARKYTERLSPRLEDTGETDALGGDPGQHQEPCHSFLAAFEFEFMGGSMGSVVGERFVRWRPRRYESRVPFVCILASAAHACRKA
jgi:acetyl-CoA carboxylase beta subunit